ncbi:MAG TPA: hypothetical protein VH763_07885 [Gemmatimonadales bacterium]
MSPQAGAAVQLAAMRGVHRLKVISDRIRSPIAASVIGPPTINSPLDLTYFGGPLVTGATNRNVFINCATTPTECWGSNGLSPTQFLRDLNRSQFIRINNEFIGVDLFGQFPVSQMSTKTTFAPSTTGTPTATIPDLIAILFSAVQTTGQAGYTSIYHLFLPQGTDVCIDENTCYSPDNLATFVFCAFHGSLDLDPSDPATHVLFTVEPFQSVPGCAIPGQAPHGTIDETASALSHEFFETMMDPDLDAWSNALTNEEGSDMCATFGTNVHLRQNDYFIQPEYSNRAHACTNAPIKH